MNKKNVYSPVCTVNKVSYTLVVLGRDFKYRWAYSSYFSALNDLNNIITDCKKSCIDIIYVSIEEHRIHITEFKI